MNGVLCMKKSEKVLGALTRARLLELCGMLEIDGVSGKKKDDLIALLAGKKGCFEQALDLLKRDELKTICRTLGLDGSGREKGALLMRILGREVTATPVPVAVKKEQKKGKKADEAEESGTLDLKALEGWLWDCACSIRGAVDAPKYKDYILPLIFVKRLSDVFDDEIERLMAEWGQKREEVLDAVDEDRELIRFWVPEAARWRKIRKLAKPDIGQKLTNAVRALAKENKTKGLDGVINIVDFNARISGERIIGEEKLSALIEIVNRHRMGLKDVEADILGRAYEYLLRKFAEGQGQSAGEFYTPREVAWIMAWCVAPKEKESVYDPCCGSGGLLIKCELAVAEKAGGKDRVKQPLQLFGQEQGGTTYAMAKMNMILHDMEGDVQIGDTMRNPKFLVNSKLRRFDMVVANPMWNQKEFDDKFYDGDKHERFSFGIPSASSADWGWVQHMYHSLSDKGRAAVVLDTGAVSRGSGSHGTNKEKDIRAAFVKNDLVEGVLLLPENLFYNTTAPGIVLFLNRNKPKERKGKIILINAAREFEKGRPKNFITDAGIKRISDTFLKFREIVRHHQCKGGERGFKPESFALCGDRRRPDPPAGDAHSP